MPQVSQISENPQARTFDSQQQAAAALGVALSEVRRAKRSGCMAFRSGRIYSVELEQWLAANALPRTTRPPSPVATTSPAPPDEVGAAHALRRLESEELEAFRRMQEAVATGDEVLAGEARSAWLRVSESLRKHDLAVEQNRRITGESVPRNEVESAVGRLVNAIRVCGYAAANACSGELIGSTRAEAAELLDRVWLGAILDGLAAITATDKIPGWLKTAALAEMNSPLKDSQALYLDRVKSFYAMLGVPLPAESASDPTPLAT